MNLQRTEFLHQGGDETWLQGLKSIPNKLQDLYEINKILAHRPWLLNKDHIEKLTKGSDSWSLAEVVHAIVLMAHFHSLSSFVFSCGINEELDSAIGHHYSAKENNDPRATNGNLQSTTTTTINNNNNTATNNNSPRRIPGGLLLVDKQSQKDNTDDNVDSKKKKQQSPMGSPPSSPNGLVGEQEVGVQALMERMKRLSEKNESYSITQEELSKRFENVETQSAELAAAPHKPTINALLDSDLGLFIEDPSFIYQAFAKVSFVFITF